jgi:hypothetical protein
VKNANCVVVGDDQASILEYQLGSQQHPSYRASPQQRINRYEVVKKTAVNFHGSQWGLKRRASTAKQIKGEQKGQPGYMKVQRAVTVGKFSKHAFQQGASEEFMAPKTSTSQVFKHVMRPPTHQTAQKEPMVNNTFKQKQLENLEEYETGAHMLPVKQAHTVTNFHP